MSKTAVFTVVSKNYLHFARTLMGSVKTQQPDWEQYVLLVDEVYGEFKPEKEEFKVISVNDIGLPNLRHFLFRYTILELNTAVKPYMFGWLFNQGLYDKVIYIDPDISLYDSMDEVVSALDDGNLMVLTPHLTELVEDGKKPGEIEILNAGTYNLGFLAVSKHKYTEKFIEWWQRKLEFDCVVDFPNGLFVDQKWINLVPGFFEDIKVLHHSGYNVAYWNLTHRHVDKIDGKYFVNGERLVFFHYSGINPLSIENISKHQNRYKLSELSPATQELYRNYSEKVINAGLNDCKNWKYAYAKFNDGTEIHDSMRVMFRQSTAIQKKCEEDPFSRPEVFRDQQTVRESISIKQRIYGKVFSLARELNPYIKDYIPESTRNRIKALLLNRTASGRDSSDNIPRSLPNSFSLDEGLGKGINIIGYIRAEMGIGEVARVTAKAVDTTETSFGMIDFAVGNSARMMDLSWSSKQIEKPVFNTNVVCVNADQVPVAYQHFGHEFFSGHYNIGYWVWELPEFPEEWIDRYDLVHEIWVPSSFALDSLSRKSTVPVIRIPYAISVTSPKGIDRSYFGLPKDKFLFLSMYDAHSFQPRKNPQAVLRAFKSVFEKGNDSVGLVLKVNNAQSLPEELEKLKNEIEDYKNIFIIEQTLSREDVNGLISSTDCFVSLHRSEGFGLVMAEAMCLGRAVIGTNWSGNVDFMNNNNSCPVDYTLVQLGQDYGPYKAHQFWAEPDVEHAAYYMKKLVSDSQYYAKIASKGQQTIIHDYSPEAVGKLIRQRLKRLQLI